MLIPVKFGDLQKYVSVTRREDGFEDFEQFYQKVIEKLGLPLGSQLHLTDETGTEVEADIFGELMERGNITINVSTHKSTVVLDSSPSPIGSSQSPMGSPKSDISILTSPSPGTSSASDSDSTIILKSNGGRHADYERQTAKQMVLNAIQSKPGGQSIIDEYHKLKKITERQRKAIVNHLVANMIEAHGRSPPVSIRIKYALGVVTAFPCLRDPYSDNGYEHFYDPVGGSGFLAWRLKTCQRSTLPPTKRQSKSFDLEVGPKRKRPLPENEQLHGDDCLEAVALLKHSANESVILEKMSSTFQYRQSLVRDQEGSLSVLDVFPRFLDTPGLIEQDFAIMFGEEVSNRFISKWPTFFKPRVLGEAKDWCGSDRMDSILSEDGWDSDLSSVVVLLHMLPPTPRGNKKSVKISTVQAMNKLVKYLQIGDSIEIFLAGLEPGQPRLLCIGQTKKNIQKFYIIVDHKPIPCKAETSLAAFDELFKSHFIFGLNYDESLTNFYTFIQTTVYNIDVSNTKESPRVKELRAKILNTDN